MDSAEQFFLPHKLTKSLLKHWFMAAQKPSAAELMHREQSYIDNVFMARNDPVIHTNDWARRDFIGHTADRPIFTAQFTEERRHPNKHQRAGQHENLQIKHPGLETQ